MNCEPVLAYLVLVACVPLPLGEFRVLTLRFCFREVRGALPP